ncbi:MAG: phosphate acyltransferase PlsX [Planctomycetes bacterium]|nr:phosphate acyltransferase PlsX [Planctomycetota bacterium]
MRIALDAMGGDHAPGPIVLGAVQAVQRDPDLRVVLVGDQAQIEPHLASAQGLRDRLEVFHCTQVVGMEESPGMAFRKKPDNSITRAWQLLQQKKVDAVVSAGNTGAMVAGGFLLRLFLKGVRRPGIAALMPTEKGLSVLLDVGANVHPKPEHLYQYGVMGAIYAKHILQRDKPKIGLLNVGAEEDKGNELAKETQDLFRAGPLKDQFIGNIEGRDINKGVCEVIVTDGFVGNVVLKVCEGVFDFVMKVVGKEILGALQTDKLLGQQAFQGIIKRYDYHELGGAPLLGVDGICIICHGSSKERAIENALNLAAKHGRAKLNELIVKELGASAQASADA